MPWVKAKRLSDISAVKNLIFDSAIMGFWILIFMEDNKDIANRFTLFIFYLVSTCTACVGHKM